MIGFASLLHSNIMNDTATQSQESGTRFPLWLRWVLAGPVTLIIAIAIMASSSTIGGGETPSFNAIAFAAISFPAFWGALFFYYLLEEKPIRAGLVTLALVAANATILYSTFTG